MIKESYYYYYYYYYYYARSCTSDHGMHSHRAL